MGCHDQQPGPGSSLHKGGRHLRRPGMAHVVTGMSASPIKPDRADAEGRGKFEPNLEVAAGRLQLGRASRRPATIAGIGVINATALGDAPELRRRAGSCRMAGHRAAPGDDWRQAADARDLQAREPLPARQPDPWCRDLHSGKVGVADLPSRAVTREASLEPPPKHCLRLLASGAAHDRRQTKSWWCAPTIATARPRRAGRRRRCGHSGRAIGEPQAAD
jgi:hypothetical protein